jgi:cation:H+ antiporter
MIIFKLVFGFIMLIAGANLLVEGAVKVAQKFKVSTMIISMTIISIGTSMPELVIAAMSSIRGSQIALSNNIGSIISTIAISIGITAMCFTMPIKKDISKEIMRMLVLQVVLLLLLVAGNGLDRIDGIIFLTIFFFYMKHLIRNAKKVVSEDSERYIIDQEEKLLNETEIVIKNSIISLALFIIIGIILVGYGGDSVVDAATAIAKSLNLSEAFIGVTLVAFGTTLPEVSTALVAARKREHEIAIGNVLGSGVSNILLNVGVAALLNPIAFTYTLLYQIGFMLLFGLFFYKLTKQERISRSDGLFLVVMYILFAITSFVL